MAESNGKKSFHEDIFADDNEKWSWPLGRSSTISASNVLNYDIHASEGKGSTSSSEDDVIYKGDSSTNSTKRSFRKREFSSNSEGGNAPEDYSSSPLRSLPHERLLPSIYDDDAQSGSPSGVFEKKDLAFESSFKNSLHINNSVELNAKLGKILKYPSFDAETFRQNSSGNRSPSFSTSPKKDSKDATVRSSPFERRSHSRSSKDGKYPRSRSHSRDRKKSPKSDRHRSRSSDKHSERKIYSKSRRSRSPKGRSPVRGRSRSPVKGKSRSPLKGKSRSPVKGRSNSPRIGRGSSPRKCRSRSPRKGRSPSPRKGRSRSPRRVRSRSPRRVRSRSPRRVRSRSPRRSRDHRRSRSRSYDRYRKNRRSSSRSRYRRNRYSRSRSRDRSRGTSGRKPGSLPLSSSGGAMTPQMALQQTMAAMSAKAQAMTGIALPKYYNPAAVNPLKYAEQVQKRKLLWQNKEKEDEQPKNSVWDKLTFDQDQDGKMTAKFRKLMGIKSDGTGEIAEGEVKESVLQKQADLFRDLDQQYEMARMTTHTQRGVGLGYSATTLYPPVQK